MKPIAILTAADINTGTPLNKDLKWHLNTADEDEAFMEIFEDITQLHEFCNSVWKKNEDVEFWINPKEGEPYRIIHEKYKS